jgi:cation diffusion facilitator family transporter
VAANSLTTADVGAIKQRALRISLFAITSVFVFEFAAGLITNSLALLTDSVHALLDVVVTLVLIIATTLALKPRDTDHTYGHGKIETIGGFIGGAALFVVAVFFIYEAIVRIAVGDSAGIVRPAIVGFAAIAYTMAIDVFRILILRRAERTTSSSTIRADLYHAIADLASTVVALVGLWVASLGIVQGDPIAAIILGGVLSFLSIRFVYRNATELTDFISPKLVARVQAAASETQGVLDCRDIKVRRVGRDAFVDITVTLRAHLTFEDAHETSDMVAKNIADVITAGGLRSSQGDINVHFEPTIKDSSPESIVEVAAARIHGVRGVHNILISKVAEVESIGVSLHVQVNKDAPLSEAHALADAVEDSIRRHLGNVDNITVHLEPHMAELARVRPASSEIKKSINDLILARNDVERINKTDVYATDFDVLKIDIVCVFKKDSGVEMTIEQAHKRVSELEELIRSKYPGSIVTIHAEPK